MRRPPNPPDRPGTAASVLPSPPRGADFRACLSTSLPSISRRRTALPPPHVRSAWRAFETVGLSKSAGWLIRPPAGHDTFHPGNMGVHGIAPDDVLSAPGWTQQLAALVGFIGGDAPSRTARPSTRACSDLPARRLELNSTRIAICARCRSPGRCTTCRRIACRSPPRRLGTTSSPTMRRPQTPSLAHRS